LPLGTVWNINFAFLGFIKEQVSGEGYIYPLILQISMSQFTLKVKGMHCKSCEVLLKDSIEELHEVKVLKADHKSGILEIEAKESQLEQIKSIIKKEGYTI